MALKSLLLRVAGTTLLIAAFVVFMVRAPFITDTSNTTLDRPAPGAELPAALLVQPSPLNAPTMALQDLNSPGLDLRPSFGLFDATFAAAEGQAGFDTAEVAVPGSCADAGKRYFQSACPGCLPIGGEDAYRSQMIAWYEPGGNGHQLQSVSRDCISTAVDGSSIVGTVTLHDGLVDLAKNRAPPQRHDSRIPLLAGASRVASISLGTWSATYDEVVSPGTALRDMAAALERRGWREVEDPTVAGQQAFEGHRIFTDQRNALCMISLTKLGDVYQLLTILDAPA